MTNKFDFEKIKLDLSPKYAKMLEFLLLKINQNEFSLDVIDKMVLQKQLEKAIFNFFSYGDDRGYWDHPEFEQFLVKGQN